MKKFKYLMLMFAVYVATVKIPLLPERVYKDVVNIQSFGNVGEPLAYYVLTLKNGKVVYVPVIFTVIEEK